MKDREREDWQRVNVRKVKYDAIRVLAIENRCLDAQGRPKVSEVLDGLIEIAFAALSGDSFENYGSGLTEAEALEGGLTIKRPAARRGDPLD